jgi:putative ABC transport system permease protein
LGIDPADPVFASRQLAEQVSRLRTPDTVLADARCRSHLGRARPGETTEVSQRKVTITGEFQLGTDFLVDGTLITSDRTFFNLFPDYRAVDSQLNRVEIGLLAVENGRSMADVLKKLQAQLPPDVKAMTREELIGLERNYWMRQSPVGLVFNLGTVVGFIVGIVICSQILFTDLSEKMPQFATLKAIGYRNGYLRGVVLKQAFLLALFGFVPGVLGSWLLYQVIGRLSGLLMRMGTDLVAIVFVLTLVMCLLSGMVSVRKVLNADPAEVF